jgi:PAS domain S-box-containing protein
MHRLLKRQLKKLFGEDAPVENNLKQLIDLVDESYNHFQSDYNKLERILELSSKESFKELSNFKNAIDTAALVSLTDAKGEILMANENFCKLSGYSLGELIGKNHSIVNSGVHDKEFWKEMWQTAGNGKIWQSEVCNRKKNKELYWVDSTIIPFLNDVGKPYQYLSIRFDISQRKKIEEEIKTLALVAQKTQNAVIISDPDGIAIWANEGFERITGYSVKEVLGKKPGWLLQGPETDLNTKGEIKAALKDIKPYNGEILNYSKSGESYWISLSITPVKEGDKHIGFIAIESDITERKAVEKRIKENEEKFRLLIESATDIFYYTDGDGNFTYVNDIATKITGFSTEELLKMNYLDLVEPRSKQKVQSFYLRQAVELKQVTYFEFPILTKLGKTAWVGQNVQLIKTSDDRLGIQAIARDITSLKDAQLEIENSHNFLNQILDSIPSPLFVKDREHKWVMVNDAYARLTGIEKNQIIGKNDLNFLPKEDAEEFIAQDEEQFNTKLEKMREVSFQRQGGDEKILLVKKTVFTNQGKDYLIGVITDITDLKEREKQIILYNKMSDQISDAISVANYEGKLIYVNESHTRNLGKSKAEMIGSSIIDMEKLFPDIGAWQQHYNEVKLKGEILIEGLNTRKDGSTFPVEASVKYIRIEDKGYIVAAIRDITERKRNEEAVKQMKEFYETVLNKIPSEVVVFDKKHRYLFVNETAVKDKVKREWLVGHDDFEYCNQFNRPIEIAKERRKLFENVTSNKLQLEFEEKLVNSDGKATYTLRRFYPILDDRKEVLHIIGFGIDITSRIEAEKQTRESEERLKLATQSANLGIWDWNIKQNTLIWDESMYLIFGVDPKQFSNDYEAFAKTLHPEDAERVNIELQASLDEHKDFSSIFRIISDNKEIKYITAFSKTFRSELDEPLRMIGVNYDVTENTLTQQKLLKQQQDLEEAQHIARVGGWEIDVKERSILWSKEMFHICEFEQDLQPSLNETYGMFSAQTRESVIQAFFNSIENYESFELEAQLKTRKGNIIDVRIKGIPYKENDKIIAIRGIFQDITKEKEASRLLLQYTEELEKKNKELDQFAYVVSHDLKAPLRGINNLSMWIEEDISEHLEGETKTNLDLMRKRVKRMEGLIDGILQYSRAGRVKHQAQTFATKDVIAELIANMSPPEKFQISIQNDLPTLSTEKIAFEQVIANYISNAIKYNNSLEPTINISCSQNGKLYEFCVADNGPGIEKEFHEKVFVIFQTLQARDTFESTGVGLAIVKKMVEDKGGKVWIESEKGKGAKFFFSWPMEETQEEG